MKLQRILQIQQLNKFKNFDNVIYYNLSFINGNIFYAIEYLYYLKEKFNLIIKVPSISFGYNILNLWQERYNKKILEIQNKIFFIIDSIANKKIISKNILILDGRSISDLDKNIFGKKIIYNYGDHEKSLIKDFKTKKNIITFGDKELGCKVNYHFPLKLNFSLFKDLKINYGIFIEDKRDKSDKDIFKRKRNIKDFHSTFNHLIYYKNNFWERANRLIPECKFYCKKIDFYNFDEFLDSADLRYWRSWEYYDINKSNFKDFIYEQFQIY